MRAALKYGVPAAAGLAAGGYALSQGEDPGSATLAAGLGALGARGGLLAGKLAGKYAPQILAKAQDKVITPAANVVGNIGAKIPAESQLRNRAVGVVADALANAEQASLGATGQRNFSKVAAAGLVPASAAAAGLGGIALGAVPGSMGVPGFQQQMAMDPESYGSSNTMLARSSVPTLRY